MSWGCYNREHNRCTGVQAKCTYTIGTLLLVVGFFKIYQLCTYAYIHIDELLYVSLCRLVEIAVEINLCAVLLFLCVFFFLGRLPADFLKLRQVPKILSELTFS